MHLTPRTENQLGAAALALTDLMIASASEAIGVGPSGAAALVTISAFPGIGMTKLGRQIGLSQSAAARVVDSLEAAGLATRQPRAGRTVTVSLTEAGSSSVRDLLNARSTTLADAISSLDEAEQEALARLLPSLLERLYQHVGDAQLICRLCERASCGETGGCPVGEAEKRRGSTVES